MNREIYGLQTIAMILDQDPSYINKIYYKSSTNNKRILDIIATAKQLGIAVVEKEDFNKYFTKSHQPVVALCKDLPSLNETTLQTAYEIDGPSTFIILDGITDPHNLGAILRSCAALGVTAVIAPKNNSVGITSTVRNIACGGAEIVPFVKVSNLARTLRAMKESGIWLYGAEAGNNSELSKVKFSEKVGLVFGNEHNGLKRLTRETCDELLSISLNNNMDSLNVSVAAGIFIYAAQQRCK